MRQLLILSVIFLLSTSCNKHKDKCIVDPQRNVEAFSNASFKSFEAGYYFDDMVMTAQNEVVVAGLNSHLIAHTRQPFLSLLDDGLSGIWEKTFTLDQSNLYRSVRVLPASQNKLLLISYSVPQDGTSFGLELIEYDKSGISQWRSSIKEEGENLRPVSIVEIPPGEFVILSSEFDVNSPQPEEFHLTRVASNGDEIWTKSIQTESLYLPTHLVNGPLSSSLYTVSEHFIHKDNAAEIHVHKLDYDANLVWKKALVVSGRLWPTSSHITAIENEDLLVSFSSRIVGEDIGHISLIKMDQSGAIQWEKKYELCGDNVVCQVLPTRDGNLILLSNTSAFGAGDFDIMITKMDSTGTVLWEKVYGGMHSDQANKIVEKPNGNFIISGNTNEGTVSESVFEGFIFEINKDGIPL